MSFQQTIAKNGTGRWLRTAPTIAAILSIAAVASFVIIDDYVFSGFVRLPKAFTSSEFFKAFTQFGKAYLLVWLLLTWIWAGRNPRPALAALLALLLVAPSVGFLKALARRPRPRDVIKADIAVNDPKFLLRGPSFPSGDTASAFAVATSLAGFVRRRWAVLMLAISTTIGALRVFVMAHYPSDVLAGAALGLLCGWVSLRASISGDKLESVLSGNWQRLATIGVFVMPILIGLFIGHRHLRYSAELYLAVVLGSILKKAADTLLCSKICAAGACGQDKGTATDD